MCYFVVERIVVHLVRWIFRCGPGLVARCGRQERPSGYLGLAHGGENM